MLMTVIAISLVFIPFNKGLDQKEIIQSMMEASLSFSSEERTKLKFK